nr:orotidine 5'-phosphate decarboxylase [bacterium]
TLNPLMGYDSLEPFLAYTERGVFVLVLTSNPGAADFQLLETARGPLYLQILQKVLEWNQQDNLGAVVGATHPAMLKGIRELAPDLPLLLPGIGSQGGDLEATVAGAAPTAHAPFLVNVSRAVLYPQGTGDFQQLVRAQAEHYRDSINQAGKQHDV